MRTLRNALAIGLSGLLLTTLLIAPSGGAEAAAAQGTLALAPGQRITAHFSGTKLDKKRPVTLQKSTDGVRWSSVRTVKMTAAGAADFGVVATDVAQYRAVAAAFSYPVRNKLVTSGMVITESAALMNPTFADEFTGSALAPWWRSRDEVGYRAQGRFCSAPVNGRVSVASGSAAVTMAAVSASEARAVDADARLKQAALSPAAVSKADASVASAAARLASAKALSQKTRDAMKKRADAIKKATAALNKAKAARAKLTPGCPTGVFHNGMVTTRGSGHAFTAGSVVARVKFPVGQGAHGGIWMRADNGQEIDVIEAYGYGRGVTNIVHRLEGSTLKKDPAVDKQAYVAAATTKNKSWWSTWHTVAVSFDERAITFSLDGVRTRRLKAMTAADYDLVLSLLSSDWETYRIKNPDARPGSGVKKSSVTRQKSLPSMAVDWIRVWEV